MKSSLAYLCTLGTFLCLLPSCGDPDEGGAVGSGGAIGTGGNSATASLPLCEGGTEVVIRDATNYAFTNALTVAHTRLKDATNLTFDWGGLTQDLFGHDLIAAQEVDSVLIALMGQTPQQIEAHLGVDGNLVSYNKGAINVFPDGSFTSAQLAQFSFVGQTEPLPEQELWNFFDTSTPSYQFDPAVHTFLVMAQTGTEPGKNARMLHMFSLDPTATETSLSLTNQSTRVDYEVELEQAEPVAIPLGAPGVSIKWNEMTTTALGNPFVPTHVTEVAVAHYSLGLAELEANFLDLQGLALGWWSGTVAAGVSIDLASLKDEAGGSFPGISTEGVWLFATFCTVACSNPAPWSLTRLTPCP